LQRRNSNLFGTVRGLGSNSTDDGNEEKRHRTPKERPQRRDSKRIHNTLQSEMRSASAKRTPRDLA
jgi:hypothetical protein